MREITERSGRLVKCPRAALPGYPTIKLENIISHKEAHARGYASNHADCDHWLTGFGKNMDCFRGLVHVERQFRVAGSATVPEGKVEALEAALAGLGRSVVVEDI